jgi:hypothetical protein
MPPVTPEGDLGPVSGVAVEPPQPRRSKEHRSAVRIIDESYRGGEAEAQNDIGARIRRTERRLDQSVLST